MSTGLAGDSLPPSGMEQALSSLCEAVFTSMQRSDQRAKGERYARGLLFAEGRKSMRNIALQLGPGGEGQSMHHFISSSTWDWRPVREALARHLQLTVTPAAWVLRSMVVPKAGEHTVGVARRVDPESGRVVNSQQSYGLWLASRQLSSPVNWGLHLPAGWLADERRRSRAKIPDRLGSAGNSPGECASRVVLEVADGWGLPRRPVVLEIGEEDAAPVLAACASAGVPFLARIGPATLLTGADSVLPERIGQRCSAQGLVSAAAARTPLRPVQWWDAVDDRARTTRVAAVRVQRPQGRLPDRAQALAARQSQHRSSWGGPYVNGRRTLTLLGEWSDNRAWPTDFWLTDLTAPPGKLLRLAKLARRVERDAAVVGEEVGLRGFVGRSFEGWHRHTTLASVAHAVRVLDAAPAEYASA